MLRKDELQAYKTASLSKYARDVQWTYESEVNIESKNYLWKGNGIVVIVMSRLIVSFITFSEKRAFWITNFVLSHLCDTDI